VAVGVAVSDLEQQRGGWRREQIVGDWSNPVQRVCWGPDETYQLDRDARLADGGAGGPPTVQLESKKEIVQSGSN